MYCFCFLFCYSTKHYENYYATDDSYNKMPGTHTASKPRVFKMSVICIKVNFIIMR